jgi:hypothetical protein
MGMLDYNDVEHFDCECGHYEHTIRIIFDREVGDLTLEVFLSSKPWYKRLWIGIKYILGFKTKFGEYASSTIVQEKDLKKFEKLIKKARKFQENNKQA